MNDKPDSFMDITKTMDYFLAMIRSYYPEYQPSEIDKNIWREATYEMFIIDNKNFEQIKDVIDFISMNDYWRQNISNLKQVRNRYHDIMRDMKALETRKNKEKKFISTEATTEEVEKRLKEIVYNKEKKERTKERKEHP